MTKISSIRGKMFSSKIKVELLVFFEQNPWTMDTVDGIAMRIGKTGGAIQEDLEDLEDAGFLKRKYIGNVSVFQMNPLAAKEIKQLLSEYNKMMESNKDKDK